MGNSQIIIAGLALLIIGPIVLFVGIIRLFKAENLTDHMSLYIQDPNELQKALPKSFFMPGRQLSGSIFNRTMLPKLKWIGRQMGRMTPSGAIQEISNQLTTAGNPMGLEAREFFGLRLGTMVIGAGIAVFVISQKPNIQGVLFSAASFMVFYILPSFWLKGAVKQRQNKIRKGFPDAMDMLSVCASAGLGFDQALQRVSEHWNTPVGNEFARVIAEIEMGLSRKDALRNLADRVLVPEVSSFVSFVMQTEQLGLSISDTLHAQAEQMRIERRQRAQEQAQKIPTKMVFPMALLIFPALMAIILGPAIPNLVTFFDSFAGK